MTGIFGIFRYTTMLFLLAAGALSLILFSVKYQVQDLEQELRDLNRAIIADREAVHVLKAEWAYLNDPVRLKGVVAKFFSLEPIRPDQMVTFDDLSFRPSVSAQVPDAGKGGAQ